MKEDVYRSAASIVVLRSAEVCAREGCTVYQMLLLHKPRKNDAWQLPQGGVEAGESLEQAALRELKEEAGIGAVQVLGRSGRVYQYDFPPGYRRFRPDNVKGQRIGFVFAIADAGAEVRVDGKEVDAYAWVDPPHLPLYIQRKAYAELVCQLGEEAAALVS